MGGLWSLDALVAGAFFDKGLGHISIILRVTLYTFINMPLIITHASTYELVLDRMNKLKNIQQI